MFEMDPDIPEAYCIFPGHLPERLEGELVLIGVSMTDFVMGLRLEVIAIGMLDSNENVQFLRPDKVVAGTYAHELAKRMVDRLK
jgi:hypothetical protein